MILRPLLKERPPTRHGLPLLLNNKSPISPRPLWLTQSVSAQCVDPKLCDEGKQEWITFLVLPLLLRPRTQRVLAGCITLVPLLKKSGVQPCFRILVGTELVRLVRFNKAGTTLGEESTKLLMWGPTPLGKCIRKGMPTDLEHGEPPGLLARRSYTALLRLEVNMITAPPLSLSLPKVLSTRLKVWLIFAIEVKQQCVSLVPSTPELVPGWMSKSLRGRPPQRPKLLLT